MANKIPEEFLEVPGLVGEIVRYINESAIKKQPILAVGAALTFIGTVKGHRVESETKIRSNLYVMGLGESGCGKDHPRKCIEELAKATDLEQILLGNLVSGTGLLTGVKRANGRALAVIDEVGQLLAALTGKNAQSWQRDVITNIMKLYSSAGGKYRGAEYANSGDRNDIVDPCFSIFGLTVPSRFWNALTGEEVIDGFLNRIIVNASEDHDPIENLNPKSYKEVPQSIVDRVIAINNLPTDVLAMPGTIPCNINPRKIYYTAEALEILNEFKALIKSEKNYAFTSGDKTHAIWVRAAENAIKVALIIQDGDFITATDMKWACLWVHHWINYVIKQIKGNIGDSPFEKDMNYVLNVIRNNTIKVGIHAITHRELTQKTRRIKPREMTELLNALLQNDSISVQESTIRGQKSRHYSLENEYE